VSFPQTRREVPNPFRAASPSLDACAGGRLIQRMKVFSGIHFRFRSAQRHQLDWSFMGIDATGLLRRVRSKEAGADGSSTVTRKCFKQFPPPPGALAFSWSSMYPQSRQLESAKTLPGRHSNRRIGPQRFIYEH